MGYNWYRSQNAAVSEKRISNIVRAFPFVDWDVETIATVTPSFDAPQFSIKGIFTENCKSMDVMYISRHPGGNSSRFHFSHANKRITQGVTGISPAPFKKANEIHAALKSFVK